MVFDRLQFREASLFASPQIRHSVAQLFKREKAFLIGREQALDALSTTREIATQRFFPALGRIGLSCGLEPAIELFLYETWLFEQARNFFPYHFVQQILTNRATVANRAAEPAPAVRTEAAIVINGSGARPRRRPIETVAALGAAHQALHDAWRNRAARRVLLVGLQALRGQGVGLFADDRRHGDLDPLGARKLMIGAVARRDAAAQSQRPRYALTRRGPRLSKASLPDIGGIAQHRPDRRTLPLSCPFRGRDLALVETTGDRADAQVLDGVKFIGPPHDARLLFVDLIIGLHIPDYSN